MKSKQEQSIAIIGAGVAGLSMASKLSKLNINFTIFERAKAIRDNGLGFLILSNGLTMFDKMDLLEQIQSVGNSITEFNQIDRSGKLVTSSPMDDCMSIRRKHCINSIYKSFPSDTIIFGKELIDFQYNTATKQTRLQFSDGSSDDFDIVIAADGVSSTIRQSLFPTHRANKIPHYEIAGAVNNKEFAQRLGHRFTKVVDKENGFNMGLVPTNSDSMVWFIQFDANKNPMPENKPELLLKAAQKVVADFPSDFKFAVQHQNIDDLFLWDIFDVDLLPSFHKDGIVLIGDACHPLLPFTSQGINSALEDAYLLAELLQQNLTRENIFQQYYNERQAIIEKSINDGRILLDQFLYPDKYEHFDKPFIQHSK